MTGFNVVAVELQFCGDQLRLLGSEVRGRIEALCAESEALLVDGWQGRAAQDFARYWDHWRSGAGDVVDALEHMSRMLADSGRAYAGVEAENARNVPAAPRRDGRV